MYRWLVFLHVLAAFGFFLAHGMAVTMSFRLRQERAVERVRALLEASVATIPALMLALVIVLLTGIVLGFMGAWWRTGWVWTSLALLVALFFWMASVAERTYGPIRRAAGLPHRVGNKIVQPEGPADEAELARVVGGTRPWPLFVGGLGTWAVILYLMMFKPF